MPQTRRSNDAPITATSELDHLRMAYVRTLHAAIERADHALKDLKPETVATKDQLTLIFGIFHDMKGQGATFGYDLITDLGELVTTQLRHRTQLANHEISALEQCIAAARHILENTITGQAGISGKELLSALQSRFAIARLDR